MDITDQEIFDTALTETEQEPNEAQPDEVVAEQGDESGQPRDEHGRFAGKQPQAEQVQPQPEGQQPAQAGEQPQGEDAHVPSWRMRELREERDAAVRRSQETDQRLMRHIAELQARLPQQEPQSIPSVFEDEQGFLQHGVKQAIDPIQAKLADIEHRNRERDEYLSRQYATQTYGADKVQSAEQWIRDGYAKGDPDVLSVYDRAFSTFDPIGEIVKAHQQRAVYQQIGNDPNAWFEKQIEERMKDPTFAGALLAKIQGVAAGGQQQPNGSGTPIVKLPPSLNRVASAQGATADNNDMSDEALFAHAMR